MFERRLKFLLVALGAVGLVLLLRLGQLQLLQADYYRERAEASLIQRPQSIPFVRGSILDRNGQLLVSDQPCWNLSLDYAMIAAEMGGDSSARRRLLQLWKRSDPALRGLTADQVADRFDRAVALMWSELDRFASSGGTRNWEDVRADVESIYHKVQSVRHAVALRRGFDAPVAEEYEWHPILEALSAEEQIEARERFAPFPWIRVEPSSVRRYHGDATALAHVLGRTGRVTAETVLNDPVSDDPFAAYRADETVGITGVEWLAESTLRGRRGQITRDRNGTVIESDSIAAQHGRDVHLTLDRALQDELYLLLEEAVSVVPQSSGGAVVVLDVPTREVRALVSYPSYDPARFDESYAMLRDDTVRLPLRFRAVSNRYAPGSTVKPLVCLSGLMNEVITLDTRETCTGYLFPENRSGWRCWQIHGSPLRKAHGPVNVEEALIGSCNIFMYRLGERIGVDRLCGTFDMIGIGRSSGIGLREEDYGINPTPSWLMTYKSLHVTPGTARLFAMGQGELSMTPLQVANLMATYASGQYREIRLVREAAEGPVWTLPATQQHWRAIRRAMYGVVNNPDGTAYDYAHFVDDRFALLGKTGSATAAPWPTSYRVPFEDESGNAFETIVRAGSRGSAIELFAAEHPTAMFNPEDVEVAARWPTIAPPSGEQHAHAWFGGILQPLDNQGQPDWDVTPRFAFAALIEFGGSGGRVSGPLAKRIARTLADHQRDRDDLAWRAAGNGQP